MGRLLLVRHGQASWGADDYDVLSPLGHQQGAALGETWRRRGVVPDRVVTGSLRRHRETAEAAGLGVDAIDAGWDEFDHVAMLARVPMPDDAGTDRGAFQRWFETASMRWTDGAHDDYDESFAAFTARVSDALVRAAEPDGTTAIVTSGGPIAWVCASLLADETEVRTGLWHRLNRVCANSGITHVVSGRRGISLVSFNEHTHLEGSPELLSYR
jgi:broad specificity phosphatase PhoE